MFRTRTRWIITLGTVAAITLGPVAESQAFFGLWRRWRERYQAQNPALVAQPACAPQVVNYVPQTCYRTQYCSVPVTTYRQQAGFDPNTNCPVTCMRPVTTYVTQARMVPYTTYRLQYSSPCNATAPAPQQTYYAPAAAMPTTTTYMPTTTYAAPQASYQPTTSYSQPGVYGQPALYGQPAPSGCSNCAAGGATYAAMPAAPSYSSAYPSTPSIMAPPATTQSYAPPTTYPQPPAYAAPSGSTTQPYTGAPMNPASNYPGPIVGAPTPVPSLNTTPSTTPNSPTTTRPLQSTGPATTYENGGNGGANGYSAPAGGMPPIVDPMRTPAAPMSGPGLLDPRSRTTSMPTYRPGAVSQVNWPVPTTPAQPHATLMPVTLPIEISLPTQPVSQPQPAPTGAWRASRR